MEGMQSQGNIPPSLGALFNPAAAALGARSMSVEDPSGFISSFTGVSEGDTFKQLNGISNLSNFSIPGDTRAKTLAAVANALQLGDNVPVENGQISKETMEGLLNGAWAAA